MSCVRKERFDKNKHKHMTNKHLGYGVGATKVGFSDMDTIEFADAPTMSPDQQKNLIYSIANTCRAWYLPEFVDNQKYLPVTLDNRIEMPTAKDLTMPPLKEDNYYLEYALLGAGAILILSSL